MKLESLLIACRKKYKEYKEKRRRLRKRKIEGERVTEKTQWGKHRKEKTVLSIKWN